MTESDLNIHQRLLAVAAEITSIVKEGTAPSEVGGYNYITHDQIARLIRPLLVKHRVGFSVGVVDYQHTTIERERKAPIFGSEITIRATFTNVDKPDEVVSEKSVAWALDTQDKGVGKAYSYAMKYLLGKMFMMDAGSEDVDADFPLTEIQRNPKKAKARDEEAWDEYKKEAEKPKQPHPIDMPASDSIPFETWEEIIAQKHSKGAISAAQLRRLYAVAVAKGWNQNEVSQQIKNNLDLDPNEIPWGDCYKLLVEAFQNHGPSPVDPELGY